MAAPLDALLDIISSQVKTLQAAYNDAGLQVPSVDEQFHPSALEMSPTLAETRRLIAAAAYQLIATVRSPIDVVQEEAMAMFMPTLLAYMEENNIPEILREAGPKGLHLNDIAARSGVDASTLGRFMRYLATRHVFKELSPNVFTNNRLSSVILKAKTLEEIHANPIDKYEGAPVATFISYGGEELLKVAPYIVPFLKDPSQAATPFNMAYSTPKSLWEWFGQPGNEWRAKRQAVAMAAAQFPPEIFVKAIAGETLKPGDVVVDVGGSTGSATLILYNAFPNLRYVVQDLEQQIVEAGKYWTTNAPTAIASGAVTLQVHDFLTPQPIQGAAMYFLRWILHDWNDAHCHTILRHLRAAAAPTSKIVAFEFMAQYTCASESDNVRYPLLGNLGVPGGASITNMDLGLLATQDGKERTKDEFEKLGMECGWKLESVIPGPLNAFIFVVI